MVMQSIFFGSLKFIVHTPRSVRWKTQEMNFFVPSLPAIKSYTIEVVFDDRLPDPEGRLIYQSGGISFYEGEAEERLYRPTYDADQKTAVYSRFDGDSVKAVYLNDHRGLWTNPNFHLLTMVHIERLLLDNDGLILHSCYTEYQGQAILFTAPSGTGKTTQAEIWKRVYGNTIVNGDKCILQKTDTGFMACGFFLHGSAPECENRSLPIRAVVIVRQSQTDYVEELSAAQKIGLLYSETTVNIWDDRSVLRTMDLLEAFVKETTVLMLHCTMQDSAARTLHEYLYGD